MSAYPILIYIWKLSLRSFDPPLVALSCRFLWGDLFLDQLLHELSQNDVIPNQSDKAGVMVQEFLCELKFFLNDMKRGFHRNIFARYCPLISVNVLSWTTEYRSGEQLNLVGGRGTSVPGFGC